MPTLEVQLAKAQKDLAAIGDATPSMFYLFRRRRADQYHDKDAERRGLMERVRYLQQRIAARNERAAPPEVDLALVRLAEYQSLALPTHTSEPTAPA